MREATDMAESVCFALGVSYARIRLYIFLLWWLVETRNPHEGSPHCCTKNIREKHVNKSIFLIIPFQHVSLLFPHLLNTWLHRFVYMMGNMTHSLWVISKKGVICVFTLRAKDTLFEQLLKDKSHVVLTKQRMYLCFTIFSRDIKGKWIAECNWLF